MKYDMRLKSRESRDVEDLRKMPNSIKIMRKTINNVPCVEVTNSKVLNELIRDTHMQLLQKAALRTDGHRYDEIGILMELVEPYGYETITGQVNPVTGVSSVDPMDERFVKYLALHSNNQLLFMHNHPNNSNFSYGDLYNFIITDEIKVITAIGNLHGIYSMWKEAEFDKNRAFQYMNSLLKSKNHMSSDIAKIKHDVATELIKNASKINIGYRYTESRNWKGGSK